MPFANVHRRSRARRPIETKRSATCGPSAGTGVSVVRARQQLVAWLDSETDQSDAMRAIELLDELLDRLPA